MQFVKVVIDGSAGAWTQATTTNVDSKNVFITNTVATEIVQVPPGGSASSEFTANHIAYNPLSAVLQLTNVNPSTLYIRAQGGTGGGAYIRWE